MVIRRLPAQERRKLRDHPRALREFVAAGFIVVPAPVGMQVPERIGLYSFIPSATALSDSTEALYELIGNVARVAFEKLRLRRHSL